MNDEADTNPAADLKMRSDMQQVGDTMLQEWLRNAGPDGQRLVDAYKRP